MPRTSPLEGSKWIGNSSFQTGDSKSFPKTYSFDSDVPAKTCPSIYTLVTVGEGMESQEIPLIDVTLDWIQKVLDQTLKPELERLESMN